MAKNSLIDLNNHLFAQMERLTDETLTVEQQRLEIEKSKVISLISKDVVEIAKVSLDGFKFVTQEGTPNVQMPQQFQTKNLIS